MKKIGGNTDCVLSYETTTTSAIGEDISEWVEYTILHGFLDLMNNGKDYATYNKAMEDSTHVFICDFVSIEKKATELKATINGEAYDVTYIDNPMGLNYHLEVFLKKVAD